MTFEHHFQWNGRCGPLDLILSEHTFQPSTVSMLMAEALEIRDTDTVIDAGCGSGVLSIIAAKYQCGSNISFRYSCRCWS